MRTTDCASKHSQETYPKTVGDWTSEMSNHVHSTVGTRFGYGANQRPNSRVQSRTVSATSLQTYTSHLSHQFECRFLRHYSSSLAVDIAEMFKTFSASGASHESMLCKIAPISHPLRCSHFKPPHSLSLSYD